MRTLCEKIAKVLQRTEEIALKEKTARISERLLDRMIRFICFKDTHDTQRRPVTQLVSQCVYVMRRYTSRGFSKRDVRLCATLMAVTAGGWSADCSRPRGVGDVDFSDFDESSGADKSEAAMEFSARTGDGNLTSRPPSVHAKQIWLVVTFAGLVAFGNAKTIRRYGSVIDIARASKAMPPRILVKVE